VGVEREAEIRIQLKTHSQKKPAGGSFVRIGLLIAGLLLLAHRELGTIWVQLGGAKRDGHGFSHAVQREGIASSHADPGVN
jgi:hypothetical protein